MTRVSSIILRIFLLFPAMVPAQAETVEQSMSRIIALQQVQIEALRRELEDLKNQLASAARIADEAKGAAEDARQQAGFARSAAETADKKAASASDSAGVAHDKAAAAVGMAESAQRSADASVKCNGTMAIRTANPSVPSNKGWLIVTDTTVAQGGEPGGGWGYHRILCY